MPIGPQDMLEARDAAARHLEGAWVQSLARYEHADAAGGLFFAGDSLG